ncbi:hypothetical protein ALQ22_200081 [Pseudomonas savastanoi pv. retacarpa]|nr:hypothetical protein ALQ22_200081 [Pseudomonas savastanoi pv. retacarpa]
MELEVRRHRIRGVCGTFIERVQRRTHRRQLLVTAPLGCQPGRLDFQADTQFENSQHITQSDNGGRIDTEPTGAWRIENEGADAVAGLDQTGRLQARNRLAYHGAANALLFHDCGFGRQFVATLELTAANSLGQLSHQLLREAAVFSTGAGRSALIFHPTSISGLLNMG